MNEIQPMTILQPVDENGAIKNITTIPAVNSPWHQLIDKFFTTYNLTNQKNIHSIYLRGSVALRVNNEYPRDLDLIIVCREQADRSTLFTEGFANIDFWLHQNYSGCTGVDIRIIDMNNISDIDQFMLKTQSICLYGEDLIPSLPNFWPNQQTAQLLVPDLQLTLQKYITHTTNTTSAEQIQAWCSWIMKRILRASFLLVMPEEKLYTRDLYYCYLITSQHFPDQMQTLRTVLKLALNPTNDRIAQLDLLQRILPWLVEYLSEKFTFESAEASNAQQ